MILSWHTSKQCSFPNMLWCSGRTTASSSTLKSNISGLSIVGTKKFDPISDSGLTPTPWVTQDLKITSLSSFQFQFNQWPSWVTSNSMTALAFLTGSKTPIDANIYILLKASIISINIESVVQQFTHDNNRLIYILWYHKKSQEHQKYKLIQKYYASSIASVLLSSAS